MSVSIPLKFVHVAMDRSMNSKDILKTVAIVVFGGILIAGVVGYFGTLKAQIEAERAETITEIEAEKAEKLRTIEREEAKIVQAQKTERTEERSQFFQKLVPWGNDEAEENETIVEPSDASEK